MKFLTPHNRIAADLWANIRLRSIMRIADCRDVKILDLGCGPGYFGQSLAEFGNDVYYVDLSTEELAKIDATDDRKFSYDATKELPFEKNSFDWIFCGDLLEHLQDDSAALSNIQRLLKPNGRAVISVPAYSRFYGHHDKLIGHFRRYDNKPFGKRLEQCGFGIVRQRYLCSLLFLPFLINQLLVKRDAPYGEVSKIENKIKPLLNIFAEIDSRVNLPFGIGLVFVVRKL